MRTKIRLLHIQLIAELGGCERLCECFIERTPQLHSVVLLIGKDGPAVERWKKAGAEVLQEPSSHRLSTYLKIRRAIKFARPDAIIIWTMAQMPLLVSACWTSGVKEIAVHAGNPLHLTPKNKIMLIASNCLPGAGKGTLIAGSQHIADTIPGDFWLRTRALQLCYNGIDLRKFPFTPKSRASKPPIVGMVARLDPIKDQRTLLRSWKQVRNKFPRATLELAGRGPLLAELEALARSLAIDRSVRFLGNVSDIAALIRGWDVVVHSTTANEGLGLAMVETMAVGRPLVATDIGPVREIVTSNTAELVAPKDPEAMADAILRTLPYGPETQERISLARQEVEKRFSSHIMIRGYLTALGLATDQPLPYKQDAELQSIANTLP